MDKFNLNELMDLAEAYVGSMVDAIYRRLMDRNLALEDPEVVMLLTALINILEHDNRGDRPTEVLLVAAYREIRVIDRPNMKVKRVRKKEDVQTNEIMQDLDETTEELEKTRRELDEMTKTMFSTEEDRDI